MTIVEFQCPLGKSNCSACSSKQRNACRQEFDRQHNLSIKTPKQIAQEIKLRQRQEALVSSGDRTDIFNL